MQPETSQAASTSATQTELCENLPTRKHKVYCTDAVRVVACATPAFAKRPKREAEACRSMSHVTLTQACEAARTPRARLITP